MRTRSRCAMRSQRECAVSTQSSATQDYRSALCYVLCPNSSRQRGCSDPKESAASKEQARCRKGERQGEGCSPQGRGVDRKSCAQARGWGRARQGCRQKTGTEEARSQEG